MTVGKQTRPTTDSLARWTGDLSGRPERIEQSKRILAALQDDDLRSWGYERADIERELDAVDPHAPPARGRPWSRYRLERALLVAARRNVRPENALGRLVRKLREACDLVLR
jgi:hypothetical protein